MTSLKPVITDTIPDTILYIANHMFRDRGIVALYAGESWRIFHDLTLTKLSSKNFLKDVRVIYVDCKEMPKILDEDGWVFLIRQYIKTVKELDVKSSLGKRIFTDFDDPKNEHLHIKALIEIGSSMIAM